MKALKKLIFTALICSATSTFAQQAQIKGEIKGMGNGEITIHYY